MLSELIRESVEFDGPRGKLTGELSYPVENACAACLLVNPHPHMGGSLSNNVIAGLAEHLPQSGIVTLRFDYAGVGASDGRDIDVFASMAQFWQTGTTEQDPLMIEDARAASAWLTAQIEVQQMLIGYSFGAFAAAQIVDAHISGLVLISPTLQQHDFRGIAEICVPRLVIYSDDDFATPVEATRAWIESFGALCSAHCVSGADHFYRGKEELLAAMCRDFIIGLQRVSG